MSIFVIYWLIVEITGSGKCFVLYITVDRTCRCRCNSFVRMVNFNFDCAGWAGIAGLDSYKPCVLDTQSIRARYRERRQQILRMRQTMNITCEPYEGRITLKCSSMSYNIMHMVTMYSYIIGTIPLHPLYKYYIAKQPKPSAPRLYSITLIIYFIIHDLTQADAVAAM